MDVDGSADNESEAVGLRP